MCSNLFPPHFGVYMGLRLSDNPYTLEQAMKYMQDFLLSHFCESGGIALREEVRFWLDANRADIRRHEMRWMKALRDEAKGAHPSNG